MKRISSLTLDMVRSLEMGFRFSVSRLLLYSTNNSRHYCMIFGMKPFTFAVHRRCVKGVCDTVRRTSCSTSHPDWRRFGDLCHVSQHYKLLPAGLVLSFFLLGILIR